MKKKHILLIRHAESLDNAGLSTVDAHSIPLSPKGIIQAEDLARDFPIIPELIVTSLFTRTQDTAAPLISRTPNAAVETWDMIHEFTYLNREARTNKTPEERKPFAIAYWDRRDPFYSDGPTEESFFDLLKRIEDFLKKIEGRKEDAIAVFSHGQFLSALKIVKRLKKPVDRLTKEELAELMDVFLELHYKTPIGNATLLRLDDLAA